MSHPQQTPSRADRTRTFAGKTADPLETRDGPDDAHLVATELPHIPGYELLGELGRGGIGVVYQARQLALNRTVAVKLVAGTASASTLIRFRTEGEAVAKLQHPNITQVFEVGACAAGSYLALEYVDGGTLKEKIAGVPQPPRDAARLLETLARAVQHAHDRRLIHRDLKPHNVLLTAGGVPKVSDFGLVRSLDAGGGVTLTADFVGTPAYASPEQVAAQFGPVGPWTDVYGLGVILYELLTGRVPFDSNSTPEVLRAVADAEPLSPRRLRPDVPRDLETICLKCLRKETAKRYATADALAADLYRFQAGEPIAARPVGPLERAGRWAKRNPAVAALLAALFSLLTVLAVGGAVFSVKLGAALRDSEKNGKQAEHDRDAARRAEREGKEKLYLSLVSEAKAGRYSRRVGQRFDTLAALRRAVELARELDKPPAAFDELRNLAVAALALPDLKPDVAWISTPGDLGNTWEAPAVDPTGRLVAVGQFKGAVSIRRVGTGPDDCGEVARLPGFDSPIDYNWSADGRFLSVWHHLPSRLQVWRAAGGWAAPALDLPNDCLGFAFTGDGRQLLVLTRGGSPTGRVYDLESGRLVRSIPLPAGTGYEFACHPHRPEVAVALRTRAAIIDLNSGTEVGSLPGPAQRVSWHPHGELLCASDDAGTDIWDVAHRRRNWRLAATGEGNRGEFNRGGDLLVTTSWLGRLRLWNPYTGREVFAARGEFAAFGPGGRLDMRFPPSATDPAGPLAVAEAAREYRTVAPGSGALSPTGLTNVTVHPNGRLAAVGCVQGFALFDLATGAERAFVRTRARSLLFEPDGSLLVRSDPGVFRWPVAADPTDPARLRVGPPERLPVPGRGETIAASADGAVLSVSELNSGATVWRRARPHDVWRVPHTDCRHVAVSPDGRLVATGSWHGRGIKVWNSASGELVRDLLPDNSTTVPLFSGDGRYLVNRTGGQRWRVADWSEAAAAPAGTGHAAFSPDGRLAAWAGKGFVVLTDADNRELVRLEDPHQDGLHGLAFSPDGALLLGSTHDSNSVRAWDLRKVRAGLVDLGLDWDAPPYPAAAPPAPGPLAVRAAGENLVASPARMQQHERERALVALWANPLDPAARAALGEQLVRANRPREAEAHLTAALALGADPSVARFHRCAARFYLADWAGCVADADAVLAAWPLDRQAVGFRARALARHGRHADAVPALTAAITHFPLEAVLYSYRADAHQALGDVGAAVADGKRAAELANPQLAAFALNNIAWRLLAGPPAARDPKRALEVARWAVDKRPDDPVVLNTLAVAYYRNDMYTEAVPVLERGLRAGGDAEPYNLFVLAACRANLGARAQARDDLGRAVAWMVKHPYVYLSPVHIGELMEFRREAEAALAAGRELAPPPREK